MKQDNVNRVLQTLGEMFPDADCELNHTNPFELLCAVVLSAQTTDASVNVVTPALFERWPDAKALAQADVKDVGETIRSIGLYRNKARNLIKLSRVLVEDYDGEVPANFKKLVELPGVGRKTANVVMAVAFDVPSMPVDTHVSRIAKRLGFAKWDDDVDVIERKLKRYLPRDCWNKAHHQFIFFGRYHCTARRPNCPECPLKDMCKEPNKTDA